MTTLVHNQAMHRSMLIWAAATVCALVCHATAGAAQVTVDVSSRGVYTNIEFTLDVRITNAESFETPTLPAMSGIEVIGRPSQQESTRITTINGRMTQRRDVTLRFPLMVRDAGEYTIPPIEVIADGERFQSAPIQIIATSPDAGEELRAEIIAPSSIYLGQPLELTLRILIRPYASEAFGVRISGSDMWSLVQMDSSDFGVFSSAIRDFNDPRQRLPRMREVTERLPNGTQQTYYQYELSVTDWPKSAGTVELEPMQIVVAYPTRLEERRGFFGGQGQLAIAEWRPMLRQVEAPTIEVLPPPSTGQPSSFAGAVGRFSMNVRAEPKNVAVGDPITITIDITDVGGDAQLEMLQPPPLQRVDALTSGFRLPSEPLSGEVRGSMKTFRQTIRAKSADVTAIPPIPFAYFDPQAEQYVVLRSDPIAINVTGTTAVTAADVEGAVGAPGPESTQLTEFEGGLLANATGADRLLQDQRMHIGWAYWGVLLAPPIAFGVVAGIRWRSRVLREDVAGRRARRARRTAIGRLTEAQRAPQHERASLVAAAINGYVADRADTAGEAMVRADVLRRLHQWSVPDELVRDVERLLLDCDAMRYGSNAAGEANSIVERAQRCIDELERGTVGI